MPGGQGQPGGQGMPADAEGAPRGGGGRPGGFMSVSDVLTPDQKRLDDYLLAQRAGATYVAALDGWNQAQSYILATGQPFMPMGGFSGSVPSPTLETVKGLVKRGELKFFLISSQGGGFGGGMGGSDRAGLTSISQWVASTCTEVQPSEYGVTAASDTPTQGGMFGGPPTLYRCAAS